MPTIQEIIKDVEEYYKLDPGQLIEHNRIKQVAEARRLAYSLCRLYTNYSYTEIADVFHRHHTTVVKVVGGELDKNAVKYFHKKYTKSILKRIMGLFA